MAKQKLKRARVVIEHNTGVPEASGLAPHPDGGFLIVDDERGVFRVHPGTVATRLPQCAGLADLEGVCVDPASGKTWVLSERDGSVWAFHTNAQAPASETHLGKLPLLSKSRNRGWEGLTFVAAGVWSEQALLLALHQDKPRVVLVLDPHTLGVKATLRLPKKARKALGLLNDLAVHPTSGHLLLLSGKSRRLATLVRSGDELRLLGVHKIDSDRDNVPEGLTFDADGRLWVVTDGQGQLRQLAWAQPD
jgi:uncharacterized protein YjiK